MLAPHSFLLNDFLFIARGCFVTGQEDYLQVGNDGVKLFKLIKSVVYAAKQLQEYSVPVRLKGKKGFLQYVTKR